MRTLTFTLMVPMILSGKTVAEQTVTVIVRPLYLPGVQEVTISLIAAPEEAGELPVGYISFSFDDDQYPDLEILDFQWSDELADGIYIHSDALPEPQTAYIGFPGSEFSFALAACEEVEIATMTMSNECCNVWYFEMNMLLADHEVFTEVPILTGDTQLFFRCGGIGCDESDERCNPCFEAPELLPVVGVPGQHDVFTGYIDPRAESSNGQDLDLGLQTFRLIFNDNAQIYDHPVDEIDNYEVRQTGEEDPPVVVDVMVHPGNPMMVDIFLNRPIALQEWTTIRVLDAQDLCERHLTNLGDLGPGVAEPDRIDIGFLPCDVDQNGVVEPAYDLLRARQIFLGKGDPPVGHPEIYVDVNRSGSIEPLDLLRFRQLLVGTGPATQAWTGESMNATQP